MTTAATGRLSVLVVFVALLLAGCGGGGNTKLDKAMADLKRTESSIVAQTELSTATARAWPAEWCLVQVGDSKDKLYQTMGTPTLEGAGYAMWQGYEFTFKALLKSDDTVSNLLGNGATTTCDDQRPAP